MTALACFWMEDVQIVTGITDRKGNEPARLQWPPQPETMSTDKRCLLTLPQPALAEMITKVKRRLLTAPKPTALSLATLKPA